MSDRYPYVFRPARPADRDELVRLHNATYVGDESNGLNPVDRRVWDWRYGPSGQDHASSLAEHRDSGQIAAFVGGFLLRLWLRGRETDGVHTLDLMTAPSRSLGLRRVGVFARLVHYWYDYYHSAEGRWLAFGFPSTAAFKIGRRFGGYRLVRPVNVMFHPRPWELVSDGRGLETREVERASRDVDALWARCAADIELGVVRGAAYFDWRYTDHPRFRYRIVEARDQAGALRGVAVLRAGGLAPDSMCLLEWLVPEDDDEAHERLMRHCAEAVRDAGLAVIAAWYPEDLRWFERFQDHGFRVRATPIIHVARSCKPDIPIEEVRRVGYMTLADLEFL